MKKAVKVWLIIAASLVLIGCAIFVGVMAVFKWDFRKLSASEYETNEYKIEDSFKDISVITDTADVVFLLSDSPSCSVVCFEEKNAKHTVLAEEGVLSITVTDNRKWYDHIGIGIESPKITVYLPAGEYGALSLKLSTGTTEIPKELSFESADISVTTGSVDFLAASCGAVNIKCTTGSINIDGIAAKSVTCKTSTGGISISDTECTGTVKADVSTGRIRLTDVRCADLSSEGSTGKVTLSRVIASGSFNIKRSTGDVEFSGCDAGEIYIRTTTGDIEGDLLSEKVFFTKTSTGDIDVPKTSSGGRCDLGTSTGDIEIEIENKK